MKHYFILSIYFFLLPLTSKARAVIDYSDRPINVFADVSKEQLAEQRASAQAAAAEARAHQAAQRAEIAAQAAEARAHQAAQRAEIAAQAAEARAHQASIKKEEELQNKQTRQNIRFKNLTIKQQNLEDKYKNTAPTIEKAQAYVFGRNALDYSIQKRIDKAIDEAEQFFDISLEILNFVTDMSPLGVASDFYRLTTGLDTFTQRELSINEIALAGLGVATFGLASKGKVLLNLAVDFSNYILRNSSKVESALEMSFKLLYSIENISNDGKLFFKHSKDLVIHYRKHSGGIMKTLGLNSISTTDYINLARKVIDEGIHIKQINAHIQKIVNKNGKVRYFVTGLKNEGKNISTFHVKRPRDLQKLLIKNGSNINLNSIE